MLNHSPPKGADTVTHGLSTLHGKCHMSILYVLECWECGVQGIEERIYNPAGAWPGQASHQGEDIERHSRQAILLI